MALNIKDPETDRLARQLADLTDENITDAVKAALRDRLERERRRRGKKIDWALLRQKPNELARLPSVDARSAHELLGYDEGGLPR